MNKKHTAQNTQVQAKKPLVSVIMPVYNCEKYLVEAIESILKQTYRKLELIIVDDRSTDNTWSIAESFAKRYKNIKAVRTKRQTNAAGNGAMNYGFKHAKGEFVARMDADDIAMPKRVEKQVKYMLKHPELIVLGTQAKVVNAEGKFVGNKIMPTNHKDIYAQYGVFHPLIHPTVMIRRALLPNKKKIYSMKYDVNDDYYTFFTFLNRGKFANLPEKLLKYRVHGKNLSLNHPKAKFFNSVKIRIEAIRNHGYKITPKAMVMMFAQIALISLIPEKVIVPLYMTIRGIATFNDLLKPVKKALFKPGSFPHSAYRFIR